MIELKSPSQIDKMRRGSEILSNLMRRLKQEAKAGVKTQELDKLADSTIKSSKAKAAFLGYHGYPKSICTSINEEVVHGIPDERILKKGDILTIDAGVELEGYFCDCAFTFSIGKVDKDIQHLIDSTRAALYNAIDYIKEGNRISDISSSIQKHIEKNKLSVIREFVGHGIGSQLHEEPQIPNFGKPGTGVKLRRGMVLAIEPMVSIGDWRVEILDNGWTAISKDRSLTAHFEHTIAITSKGAEILTEGAY